MSTPGRHGLGDPRIAWNVLLEADLAPPPVAVVADRLAGLAAAQRWPLCGGAVVEEEPATLRHDLAATISADPVTVGRHDAGLVIRVDHRRVDGLGTLEVLGAVLGTEVRSSARGVGARATRGLRRAAAGRLLEISLRPQGVPPSARSGAAGDAFGQWQGPGDVRTAELVVAAARALGEGVAGWPALRRVSVAVGVSRTTGERERIDDDSGYLRLLDVERASADQIREALRDAPLEPGGGDAGGALAPLLRRAAPRLGSTLLVSHLGSVTAPGVEALRFFPVAGGGSGLALGAVTLEGRTTTTLRARAADHSGGELEGVLQAVWRRLA